MKHYHKLQRHGDPLAGYEISKGGGALDKNGYRVIYIDGVECMEHRVIAERVLGKPLPPGAMVHHWNEVRDDNRNENLAIFPSIGYHATIHMRMRAYAACGDANAWWCRRCKVHQCQRHSRQP